jgi:hypothetical protein
VTLFHFTPTNSKKYEPADAEQVSEHRRKSDYWFNQQTFQEGKLLSSLVWLILSSFITVYTGILILSPICLFFLPHSLHESAGSGPAKYWE